MIQAEQLVDRLDRERFLFERLVGFHELQQRVFLVGFQQLLHFVDAQAFHRGAFLLGHPGGVGGELVEDAGPGVLGERLRAFFQHERAHRVHGGLPGRVHGVERQLAVGRGLRQRLFADGGRGQRQVALDGLDLLDIDVHGRGRAGVEADELATHEIVGDLVFQRFDRGQGVGGLVAEGEDVLRAGILPGGVFAEGGVERFDVLGRHAVLAAAVHRFADGLRDGGDQGGERLVVGAGRRDDAVAVELRVGEDLHVVGRVFQRDAVFLQAEILQDLLGGGEQLRAVGILLVEGGERDFGAAGQELVRILQDSGQPLGVGDDFVHADVSVVVGVEQVEGLLVEFQVAGRATQDGPQFTVQFAEVGDVGAGGDLHAYGSADGGKGPGVRGLFHMMSDLIAANNL